MTEIFLFSSIFFFEDCFFDRFLKKLRHFPKTNMAVEQTGGLDDLLMGNVTEGSEETSEQIAARISAAQARLAAVRKDEKKSTVHDHQLAEVIKTIPIELIPFVSWLINHEIPSLTILALFSLSHKPAADAITALEVPAVGKDPAFLAEISHPALRAKIADWSRLVVVADRFSATIRLESLRKEQSKNSRLAAGLRELMEIIWLRSSAEYNPEQLDRLARDVASWCCIK